MGQGNIIGKINTPRTTSARGVWNLRDQGAARKSSTWPGDDPQWSNTKLLLKTTTAAETVIDSSVNSFTTTREGDTIQTTATPYAPYWSNYFDGGTTYLSVADNAALQMGTGNFTVEMWWNPTSVSGYQTLFDKGYNRASGIVLQTSGANLSVIVGGSTLITAGTFVPGTWHHVAVTRSGSTVTLYVNGVSVGTGTSSANLNSTDNLGVGASTNQTGNGYYPATGFLSNVRVVKGTAVYTGNFTPPTSPLTAITGTVLLTCQNSRFKDNSTNNFTVTGTGNVTVSRFAPFAWTWNPANGGSAYFDGSGDRITVPDTPSLNMGTGDFTWEAWFNTPNVSGVKIIMQKGPSTGAAGGASSAGICLSGNQIVWQGGPEYTSTGTFAANVWNHIAVTRSGTTLTFWLNGVSSGTFTNSTDYTTTGSVLSIGDRPSGHAYGQYPYTGHVANVRIVKGTAVYTSNFTPPTSPVTAVSGTSLLLNFTNAAYTDMASGQLVRPYGYPARGYAVPTNTTFATSIYFNGSTDYLNLPTGPVCGFGSGDFTLECWFFKTASNLDVLIDTRNGAGGNAYGMALYVQSNTLKAGNDAERIAGGAITNYTWNHCAVVRSGNTLNLYLNGVRTNSVAFSTTLAASCSPFIGKSVVNEYTGGFLAGVRILRRAAYTGTTYTTPTAPFTVTADTALLLESKVDTWDATGRNNLTNSATIVPTPAVPGGSSLSLSGSQLSQAFSGVSSTDFAFGTGDFTIDAWVYPTSNSGDRCIFSTRGNYTVSIYFGHYTNSYNLGFYTGGAWIVTSNVAVPANTWSHVACVRASGVVYLYLNGICVGSAANTTNLTDSTPSIGRSVSDNAYGYIGQIAELRVTKAARYTGNFTVDNTVPYSRDWEPLYNDAFYTTNSLQVKTTDLAGATNNTFRDDSTNNFLPVRYGDVTQGTFSPYIPTGYWSNYFDGSGDNLTVSPVGTPFAFGTGDFTAECWVFFNGFTGYEAMIDFRSYGMNFGLQLNQDKSNKFCIFTAAGGIIASTVSARAGQWYHLAVCRSGSTVTLYVNGTSTGTATDSTSYSATGVTLGINVTNSYTLNGFLSNVRIVKGTSVYTANFTPPTAPLTAITNTSLLTCQDNRFLDRSTNNFTLTRNGDTAVSRFSPYPFSTPATTVATRTSGSFYFDGSGDYLTVPYSSAFDLSGGDWTMECWFNANSFASGFHMVSKDTYGSNFDWSICVANSTTLVLYTYRTASSLTATVPTMNTGQWYHVAYVRQSGTNRIYLNGVQYATNTMAITNESQSYVTIGCAGWNNPGGYFPGYLSNLRIVKGTAVYPNGTTFTPPQTLTAVSGTSLLTAQNEFAFTDASSNNYTLTKYGDVLPTYKTPSGFAPKAMTYTYGGSGYFDGSGDYLTVPSNTAFSFGTGDFTIEFWMNLVTNNTGAYPAIIDFRNGVNGSYIYLGLDAGNVILYVNSSIRIRSGAINTGMWYHVALVRSGTTTTLYLNGASAGSFTSDTTNYSNNGLTFCMNSEAPSQFINGHLSNLRIVKGTAVYTSAFTPPASPVTAISGTSLLLNFDNAGVYDATGRQNLYTKNSVASSTSIRKYEVASLTFNGAANAPTLPAGSATAFAFGTGDFTIEFWLYRNGQGQEVFYDQRPQAAQAIAPTIYCEGATLYYFVNGGNQINGGTLASGTWYHIAVSRAASQTRLFVNGTQVGSTYADTNSYTCASGRPFLSNSTQEGSTAYALNSYVEGLRVSRVGRYTTNFTVPSEPFPLK